MNKKVLYKYRSLNKYTIINLAKEEMRVNSPKCFNDPYDCRVFINNYELFNMWVRANKENDEGALFYSENPIANSERNNIALEEKVGWLRKRIYNHLDKSVFIACLSEINDSMLMWSHYADYHKGICIEYSLEELNDIAGIELVKVNYTHDISKLKYDYTQENAMKKFMDECIKTKDSCWDYEKEWRIIVHCKDKDALGFEITSVKPKAIYLGTKVLSSDKEYMELFCERRKIDLYQMKLSEFNYGFEEPVLIYKSN